MKASASGKLRRFYHQFSGHDRVLVLINADPDAIASAMAVKRLLWRKVSGVTLSNINVIKRPDNIAMVRLLGVKLTPSADVDKNDFDRFVIVDSQPSHNERFAPFPFDVVIDHHPDSGIRAPFTDIRPEYGATASIMTEYIRAAKIKPSVKLATGLFYAVKTDTDNFERHALPEDMRAFQFLFMHTNIHLARKIDQADLRFDFLKYFQNAIRDMRMRRGRVFVHLGPVSNPDICVLVADFFMRVSSVQWSIVSGLCEKKLVIVFRNDGLRKNAGKVARSGFGDLGSAGGHKSMARAEISLTALEGVADIRDDKALSHWIIERTEKKYKNNPVSFRKEILGLKS
ncbi:MAG: phosphoesterase [Desulfobacteraceae bacterium 4572_88]|nr:MAG: phosphoesterase [Desulfobacteraceae bacterium 4572_88]